MHVDTCVWAHVYVHACVQVGACGCMCEYGCAHERTRVSACVHVYACVWVHVGVHACAQVGACVHVSACVSVGVHMSTCA